MIFDELSSRYYDWLRDTVCGEWSPREVSFHRLMMYLFNADYIPACEMDDSREKDGINLRYRFADEISVPYAEIDKRFDRVPCSMLEMMVALSIRIEEHIMEDISAGNRVGQWFWNMIVSLGLGSMDDKRFDEHRAEYIIDRFMRRDYQPNGQGGLFTVMNTTEDMRSIDIWYQLMQYLNENDF